MTDQLCAKCGEALGAEALTCWACGTLTAAGRRAKGLPEDEDELWRRSVEAAKVRQSQKPAVDPDEVLRKVVAETGTEDQVQRLNRAGLGHDDQRTDYSSLRGSARGMSMMGLLLAALFAVSGLLVVVFAVMTQDDGGTAAVLSLLGLLLTATAASAVYFLFRHLSILTTTLADTADNARRAVLLAREQHAAAGRDETVHD